MARLRIGILFALAVSFADVLLAFVADPTGFTTVSNALPAWAWLAGLAFVGFHVLVSLPGLRRLADPFPTALAASLWLAFLLAWLLNLFSLNELFAQPLSSAIRLVILATTAALLLSGTSRWFASISAQTLQRASIALTAILGCACLLPFLGQGSAAANALAWAPLSGSAAASPYAPEAPKHVILISVDTLRRDALTVYGSTRDNTPHMDSLAADSVVFQNAFSPAPWTIPSFISMHTGVPVAAHQVDWNWASVPERYQTLAEYFSSQGFLTAAVGYHPQLLRMGRGFEHFDLAPEIDPHHPKTTIGRFLGRFVEHKRSGTRTAELAGEWMAANQQSSSLLWVHLFEPHIAYEPPKRHVPQTELVARYGSRFNSSRKKDVRDGNIMRLAEEREWMRSLYDGEVSYEDEIVGVFLDRLKELGVYEDALIIFLSDHGEEFWEHGHWEHGQSLYNELVNVPLLIKLPQGSLMEVGASVSTAGVFATLADYYGLEQPAEENMVPSFKHLLTKQQGEGSSRTVPPVFLGGVEYFGPRQAVVWDGWKYIQHEDPTAAELYRYVEDPLELNSVIVQYPEIAAHGKMLLEQHYAAFPIITQSVEGSGISSNVASMIQEMGYTD